MHAEILVLRLVHVFSAMLWVGFMLFMVVYLQPSLRTLGPAGGQVMAALQQRRLTTVMPVIALLTLLSGFRLFWIMSAGMSPEYVHSPTGLTFGVAGLLATIAFVIGMAYTRPAMARLGTLAARVGAAPEAERAALQAEMQRLRQRGARAGVVVAMLVVLAAVGMAVARYV